MWVIDFEASGLHRLSYPISVGITNGATEYTALIRPMGHWLHWSDESAQVHGLDRDTLHKHGVDAEIVACKLNILLAGQSVYCDAIAWDSFWARVLFSDNGIHQRFTLTDAASLLDTDTHVETFLAEKAQLEASGVYRLHSAIDDARILWKALTRAGPPLDL